jgi:hypothetical protein
MERPAIVNTPLLMVSFFQTYGITSDGNNAAA